MPLEREAVCGCEICGGTSQTFVTPAAVRPAWLTFAVDRLAVALFDECMLTCAGLNACVRWRWPLDAAFCCWVQPVLLRSANMLLPASCKNAFVATNNMQWANTTPMHKVH